MSFNQPLSFDTSSVTDMSGMFHVRPPMPWLSAFSRVLPVPAACAATLHTPSRLPARASSRIAYPPFDSAGRTLLVRRQQAAHPLRVGGHLGLRLCWLRLELGSGDLPFATVAAAAVALVAAAAAAAALCLHDHGRPEDGGPGLQH